VVLQQEVEHVAVGHELRIRFGPRARPHDSASEAATGGGRPWSAASAGPLPAPPWATLSRHLAGGEDQHAQSQYDSQKTRSRVHAVILFPWKVVPATDRAMTTGVTFQGRICNNRTESRTKSVFSIEFPNQPPSKASLEARERVGSLIVTRLRAE
jgi:hypothetical protein